MEKTFEQEFDRGVVNPSHPPIIEVVDMAAASADLKAGTILSASNGVYSAAGNSAAPAAVLVEDVPKHPDGTAKARAMLHGIAVGSRLLNASQEAPNDTLKVKLQQAGIYVTQAVWDESNYS